MFVAAWSGSHTSSVAFHQSLKTAPPAVSTVLEPSPDARRLADRAHARGCGVRRKWAAPGHPPTKAPAPGIECSPSIALSRGFVPQTGTAKYLLPRPTGACRSLCLSKVGKHIISETIGDPGGYVVHVPIRPRCFKITTGKK